jgi:hypothetical protein
LCEPLSSISHQRENWGTTPGGTLVVLRSKDVFRAFEIRHGFDEAVHVGNHFQIRPLLRSMHEGQIDFYLLALSQNHVRLLRCNPHSSHEVPLPEGVPTSLETWLNTHYPNAAPDHSRPKPSEPTGSFTSTTDRDNKDQHIANFFHVINKAITDMLKDQSIPMILCGVEYERSIYKGLNTYETLVEEGVQGSPQSLKGGELHKRALEIAQEHAKTPLRKALTVYEKLGGTERVSADPSEIVKGAFQGRVAFLFASESESFEGRFDQSAMAIRNDGHSEDLVNVALFHTIAYGGEVFVTPAARVPGQGAMAAIFRF